MFTPPSRRRGLAASAILGLVAAPLSVLNTSAPAQAAVAGDLKINEVYGGGGNSGALFNADFVELYNPTSAPISLADRGLQYRSAAGGSGGVATLSGTVPAYSTYLVQTTAAGSTGADLEPDLITSTSLNMSASAGQVLLLTTADAYTGAAGDTTEDPTVIDMVGFGSSPTSFEGSGPTGANLSSTSSASRSPQGADTNSNPADFTRGTPTPTSAGPAALSATDPGSQSAVLGRAITPFTLQASGGTAPYRWEANGLPQGLSISTTGEVSGTPTVAGSTSVVATVTDASAPTPATATVTFDYIVSDPSVITPIATIQGEDTDTSPLDGATVTTRGVVTAAYPTGGLDGFALQTGGAPATPNASDGLFVFVGSQMAPEEYPTIGDTVEVTGEVSEYFGLTELSITGPGSVALSETPQPAVVPQTVIPGTDCALPGDACLSGDALDAARESHESELFKPTGDYTVTDVYDGSPAPSTTPNFVGEIGLAAESTRALVQPTELYDAQNERDLIGFRTAYNDAHRIIIDDASSTNYSRATDSPFPWFTADHYVRNGAAVTFQEPVVLSYTFGDWKIEPSGGQIVGDSTGRIDFSQNRPEAPAPVGGDLTLATFNVLNYFPTTGEEFLALDDANTCTFYTDRAGNPITDNRCNPDGPRGAADEENLQRQQAKIVHAINGLAADIVSLEEIENSAKFGEDRDAAVSTLVEALNADAGAGTWAFAPSPAPADRPTVEQEDVIRTAFIYRPASVALVGPSTILSTESGTGGAFEDAREPLAQGFKGVGRSDDEAFAVIVNHFKSKGSGNPDPDGQGNATDQRVAQAYALKSFAASFSDELGGSGAVFLTGDFNSYTMEDPVQVLTSDGYTQLESTSDPLEESYNFAGLDGSLDHVFANPVAAQMVSGVDIWNINADETVYREYSRYNYNVTDLYDTSPYRASDHNPEIVGIDLAMDDAGPARAMPRLKVSVAGKVKKDGSAKVNALVLGAGPDRPTGEIRFSYDGKEITVALTHGAVHARLEGVTGGTTVTVSYLGDESYQPVAETVTIEAGKR